ncbi:hypothetical protein MMC07_004809 [Pseudocyphellaria aurata]|nr:hypothetical protein [Pseudocyphellaria aurata]
MPSQQPRPANAPASPKNSSTTFLLRPSHLLPPLNPHPHIPSIPKELIIDMVDDLAATEAGKRTRKPQKFFDDVSAAPKPPAPATQTSIPTFHHPQRIDHRHGRRSRSNRGRQTHPKAEEVVLRRSSGGRRLHYTWQAQGQALPVILPPTLTGPAPKTRGRPSGKPKFCQGRPSFENGR